LCMCTRRLCGSPLWGLGAKNRRRIALRIKKPFKANNDPRGQSVAAGAMMVETRDDRAWRGQESNGAVVGGGGGAVGGDSVCVFGTEKGGD